MKSPKRRRLERRPLQPELLEARIAPATLFVDNTNDSGPGSLRQAILDANSASFPGLDTISFTNIPTTGTFIIQPLSPLPEITEALVIDGYSAPGASANTANIGTNAVLRVEIDASQQGPVGSVLTLGGSGGSTVQGLVVRGTVSAINGNGNGISIESSNNVVAGNFIGTDVTGTLDFGNRSAQVSVGVYLGSGTWSDNRIGGTNLADRNILSGGALGVALDTGATGTVIQGNLIGTDRTGNNAIPNNNTGIGGSASNTIIGGSTPGAGNVISGNDGWGINFAGTNTTIQGNIIGLNAAGTAPLPNDRSGINFSNGATTALVGGSAPGEGNIISGNDDEGIEIGSNFGDGSGNDITVIGNKIGTDITGSIAFGNGGHGIGVYGTSGAIIGGQNPGEGNVIAFNGGAGVWLSEAGSSISGARISGNGIHSNGGLGIDINAGTQDSFGVTENDSFDADSGPNGLLNFPKLVGVVNTGTSVELSASIQAAPNTTYIIEFFALAPTQVDASLHGEGTVFLGSRTVTTNGNGQTTAVFQEARALPANSSFSAVLIDENTGDTSEFSEVLGQPTVVYTWTGTQSPDWFNPQNWSPNGVPGTLDTVLISPIAAHDPVLNGGAVISDFNQSGRTLGGTGTLTVRTSYVWSGGAHAGPTVNLLEGASGSFGNSVPLQWIDGDLNIFGTLTVSNAGLIFNAGQLYIAPDAGLQLSAGIVDQDGSTTFSSVVVEGLVEKAGSGTYGLETIEVQNFGLIQSLAGTLTFEDYNGFAGSQLILNGGNVSSPNNPVRIEADGELHGFGTITGSVGLIGGYVYPGLGQAPGTLNITQNFVMDASSTLVVDLRGSTPGAYDQIIAGATAVLDSTLLVGFLPGYAASSGDTLNIVTAGNVQGIFQFIVGEGLLAPNYTTTAMQLQRLGQTFVWDGEAGTGNWFTSLNWSPNGVPGPGDVAVLNLAGAAIVLDSGDVTVGDFIQSNGTLTGANHLTIRGTFRWDGGIQTGTGQTLAQSESSSVLGGSSKLLDGRTLYIDGTGILNSGGPLQLANNGQLRVGDLFVIQNTNAFQPGSGGGRINIDSEAILRKATTGNLLIPSGLILQNGGTLDIPSGTLRIEAGGNSLAALYNIAPGAVLEFNSAAGFGLNLSSTIGGGGTARLVGGILDLESGTFANARVEAGTTLSIEGGIFTASASSETIDIDGTLNFLGGALTGSVQANVSGSFNLSGSGTKSISRWHVAVNGAGQWDGSGTITLADGASLDVGGSVLVESSFTIANGLDGGTLSVIPGGTLEVNDATVTIAVATNNSGAFRSAGGGDVTFAGGFIQNDGSLFIDAGSSVGGPTPLFIDGGFVFGEGTIDGSLEVSSGTVAPGPDDGSTGILLITGDYTQASDANLLIQARGTSPGSGYSQLSIGGAAFLDGRLIFSPLGVFAPPAPATFNVLTSTGTRNGTFANLDLPPGASDAYTPNGANVVFAAASVFVWDGGGGNSAWDNPLNWDLDLGFPGAADTAILSINSTIDLGSTPRTVATFQQTAGTLTGAASFTVTDSLVWNGGTMSGAGTTFIDSAATATLGGSIDRQLITRTLSNAGTLNWSGTGQFVLNGGKIDNSGAFNLLSDATMAVGSPATFNNLAGGTLVKSGGTGVSTISIGIAVNNAGTVRVVDGDLDLGSAYTQTAGLTALAGGTFITPGTLTFAGGELTGFSTINGSVSNTGATIRPGGTGQTGSIIILGNYTQGSGGTLAAELGGLGEGDFDALSINGSATLSGTLDLAHFGGFTPAAGDTFRVVASTGNPGTFTTLTGATPGKSQVPDVGGLVIAQAALGPETDVSLNSGNLVITDINGGSSDDELTITLFGSNVRISDPNHALLAGIGATQIDPNTVEVPLASITGNIQVDTLGGDDTLILDLAGGDFIVAGGLSYTGGANGGTGDFLIVNNGAQGTVTYGYTSPSSGSVAMSAFGTVSYTGLETTTNAGDATDVIVNLPTATNTAMLSDDGIPDNRLTRLAGSTLATTHFTDPTGTLTINRGSALDILNVLALPEIDASLTFGTEANPFTALNFSGAVALGSNQNLSAVASGDISFTAGFSTFASGSISLTAADLVFGSSGFVAGNGTLLLQPFSNTSTIGIGDGATGAFNLDATDLAGLSDGFSSITIGRAGTGSGTVDINASTFRDKVSVFGGTIVVTGLNAGTNDVALTTLTGPIQNGGDLLADITGLNVTLLKNGPDVTGDFFGIGGNGGLGAVLSVDATTISATAQNGTIGLDAVGLGGVSMSIQQSNTFGTGNVFVGSSTEDVMIVDGHIEGAGGFIATVTGFNLSASNLTSGTDPVNYVLTTNTSGNVFIGATNTTGVVNITSAGTVAVTGNITSGGGGTWSADGSVLGSGIITFTGTSNFDITTNGAITLGGAITVPGTLTVAANGSTDITLINAGNAFGTVNVTNGSTVSLRDDGGFVLGSANISTLLSLESAGAITQSAPIIGSGGLTKLGTGTLTLSQANTYTGATSINTGTLLLTGSIADGPAITDVTVASAATLAGSGTIGGSVSNSGTVEPGGSSVGTLTITGAYTQNSTGTLVMDLAGANAGQFDVLAIGGAANLAGQLTAITVYTPGPNDRLDILTYGSRNGDFTGFTLPSGLLEDPQPTVYALAAPPALLVVNTTLDLVDSTDFITSLREAILFANSNTGLDTITFNIPGTGVHFLQPTTALPTLFDGTIIDGYSQTGSANTESLNTFDAIITIVIDGSLAGANVEGLTLASGSSGSTIKGVALQNFGGVGIRITSDNNLVTGIIAGGSTSEDANAGGGIFVSGTGNTIGGSTRAERNLISGNGGPGVLLNGASQTRIEGNFIGTDASGAGPLVNLHGVILANGSTQNVVTGNVISGNTERGIEVNNASQNTITKNLIGTATDGTGTLGNALGVLVTNGASNNTIGGLTPGDGNVILFNTGGVNIEGATTIGNKVLGNTIVNTSGNIGIDLGTDGTTPNDPTDSDTGPNNLINFPVLISALPNGPDADVTGSLTTAVNGTVRVEFFLASTGAFLGARDVVSVAGTPVAFNATLTGVGPGDQIVATTTDLSLEGTSEFSAAVTVIPPTLVSIGDAAIVEGNNGTKQLVFTVTLSQAVPATVTVNYSTAAFSADARSATAGADYTAVTGGVVTFGPNELTQTIAITLNGDTAAEPTERFNVVLSNATNAGIDDDTGVGAILDDDHHTIALAEGSGNQVSVYTTTPTGATLVQTFTAFDPKFKGGVRVAVGDVNGDGVDDVIAGAGLGGRAKVRVFDGANNFEPMAGVLGEFSAYGRTYRGGVFVAAGDVDGDGKDDVIVTPSAGSSNRVNIFSGDDGSLLNSFRAFGKGTGGVRVAAGDVNGDGLAEIIVGTGVGSSVRVFDAQNGMPLDTESTQFRAFGKNYRGGIFVAAGDLNGDGKEDIIVSTGAGAPHIRSYLQGISLPPKTFDAYTGPKLGTRIGVLDINADGIADIISAKGRKGDNLVRVFDGLTTGSMFSFSPLSRQLDGLYVG